MKERSAAPTVEEMISISARFLAKKVTLNLIGPGLPLLAGLIAIPYLFSAIGTEHL